MMLLKKIKIVKYMKSSFQQDIFTIVSACIWKCLLLKKIKQTNKQTNTEGEVLKTQAVKLDSDDLYFKIN